MAKIETPLPAQAVNGDSLRDSDAG